MEQDLHTTKRSKIKTRMRSKVHPVFNDRWIPVFAFIELYLLCSIFGTLAGIAYSILLGIAVTFTKNKWRNFFKGSILGKVVVGKSGSTFTPLENIEISYSHPLLEPCTPTRTNALGEFSFENEVPLGKDFTLTAKIGNKNYIHQDIGEIEQVKWFLGARWLGLPISPGIPKRVDFVVSPVESEFVEEAS
ncbi:hypothetical protein C6501_15615 [Candidatus Poribacteria bacterium]|nr:MAG: hypothetical protein C6501_15615 [Candidatus Poribacteria bacterium]